MAGTGLMTKTRKTIDVAPLVKWTNTQLADSSRSNHEKYGLIMLLDHILNESGNYAGYGYLDDYDAENWTMTQDMRRSYSCKSF